MIRVHQQQRHRPAIARHRPPCLGEAFVEAAAVGDAGQAVQRGQHVQLPVRHLQFGDHARKVDRAGDLVGDGVEHRPHVGREEIPVGALDVEHAMQAVAVADRHQVFRAHRLVAGNIVGIVPDILHQLRLPRAGAASGDPDGHRPWQPGRPGEVEIAFPDFLHEMRAFVVEQDDAGDRHRQVAPQAAHDAPQRILQVLALQRFVRDAREDRGQCARGCPVLPPGAGRDTTGDAFPTSHRLPPCAAGHAIPGRPAPAGFQRRSSARSKQWSPAGWCHAPRTSSSRPGLAAAKRAHRRNRRSSTGS